MPTKGTVKEPPASTKKPLPAGQPRAMSDSAALDRFARSFETSARRWELVVYPALFAFIILAGYGFFLIYSLTQDMHVLAKNVDANMTDNMSSMSENISTLALHIAAMTDRMNEMSLNLESIDDNTTTMNDYMGQINIELSDISLKLNTMEPMLVNMAGMHKHMQAMDRAMHAMTASTGIMSRDMSIMNQNVSRPMSMMNSIMPW